MGLGAVRKGLRRLLWIMITKSIDAYDFWQLKVRRLWGKNVQEVVLWNWPPDSRIASWLYPIHKPLMYPTFVEAGKAEHMRDDDPVVGIVKGNEARAYPWWIMDNHHLVNDFIEAMAFTIIFCEACGTAVAFKTAVNGTTLTFEVSSIYNGTLAMRDHQTRSVWSPYLAKAVRGKLRETQLQLFPVQHMQWRLWTGLHPNTKVLTSDLGERTGHGSTDFPGTPRIPDRMRKSLGRLDPRLPSNTLVLGVVTPSTQKVYPLDLLRKRKVVCDELGDVPVVVFMDLRDGSYAALAFSRKLNGRTLSFQRSDTGPVDIETGSTWSMTGQAQSGPLAGTQLDFVDSHTSEWFVWAANYPNIKIAEQ